VRRRTGNTPPRTSGRWPALQPDRSGTTALLAAPSSYLLVIRTRVRLDLAVGRLGRRTFARGWHVYAGSARRGLGARLLHHLAPARPVRWHVDVLRQAGEIAEVWAVVGAEPGECALARAVVGLPGATLARGFGSSDCRCPGHLVSFRRRPPLCGLCPGLIRLPLPRPAGGRARPCALRLG
jgi:Uri superfamily endonuclease